MHLSLKAAITSAGIVTVVVLFAFLGNSLLSQKHINNSPSSTLLVPTTVTSGSPSSKGSSFLSTTTTTTVATTTTTTAVTPQSVAEQTARIFSSFDYRKSLSPQYAPLQSLVTPALYPQLLSSLQQESSRWVLYKEVRSASVIGAALYPNTNNQYAVSVKISVASPNGNAVHLYVYKITMQGDYVSSFATVSAS